MLSHLSCGAPPLFHFYSAVLSAAFLIINTHQQRFIFKALFVSARKKKPDRENTEQKLIKQESRSDPGVIHASSSLRWASLQVRVQLTGTQNSLLCSLESTASLERSCAEGKRYI